jgi:PD-(D/E)XK nuclease superfamily
MSSSEEEQKLLELIKDLEQFSREVRFPSGLNIFEAAGMHLQEIRHSNFLAFLLRPQEPHGLGAEFLRRLALKAIDASSIDPPPIKPITVALADFSDVLVSREHRNIDLLVQSKVDNLVFVIENKIESSESEDQLSNTKKSSVLNSQNQTSCLPTLLKMAIPHQTPCGRR